MKKTLLIISLIIAAAGGGFMYRDYTSEQSTCERDVRSVFPENGNVIKEAISIQHTSYKAIVTSVCTNYISELHSFGSTWYAMRGLYLEAGKVGNSKE